MFVLERKDKPGSYFPWRGEPESADYVCDLQQAQFYVGEVKDGVLSTTAPLPKKGHWVMRSVEVRLQ